MEEKAGKPPPKRWEDAVKDALKIKKPEGGWPKPPNQQNRRGPPKRRR